MGTMHTPIAFIFMLDTILNVFCSYFAALWAWFNHYGVAKELYRTSLWSYVLMLVVIFSTLLRHGHDALL